MGLAAACAEERPAGVGSEAAIHIHRAFRLFDEDGAWTEEVRRRLGCDPCERIEGANYRDPAAVYLFNRDRALVLTRDEIESALIGHSVQAGEPIYPIFLTLSDAGLARVAAFIEQHGESTAVNLLGNEVLGVTPLHIAYDWYTLGYLKTEEDAVAVARQLGVPYRVQDRADPGQST